MKKQAIQKSASLVPVEIIQNKIYLVRGRKVMLDRDLAELYGVETRRLNEQVKRNLKRFPLDFMYQLTKEEAENWMSQIAISNKERMGIRKMPYVFTEQGVAMLSSVLNSDRAIEINLIIPCSLLQGIIGYNGSMAKNESVRKGYNCAWQTHYHRIGVEIKSAGKVSTIFIIWEIRPRGSLKCAKNNLTS